MAVAREVRLARVLAFMSSQRWHVAILSALFGLFVMPLAQAQSQSDGLTQPIVLPAFDPNAASCLPPGLIKKLVFLQDNRRQFMQGVDAGLRAATKDRDLDYEVRPADNDASLMVKQAEDAMAEETGAVVVAPIDPRSMARPLKGLISAGTYVGAVVPPPATTILNAPQYETGKVLGDAAARYIETELGGQAKVVLLTHDSNQYLAPRFVAMRDSLARVPGAAIVADISPPTVDKAGGLATMQTILLAHPSIDVVLGADTVVLGALDALRQAGKERLDQFLGGIDGEPEAIAEIKAGGPYKVSVSLASPIFGYALGQFAADWMQGKSVPQGMDILPRALNAETIMLYEADLATPGAVYADPGRRNAYLRIYGNICADTRDQYLNFPWSSETR